MDTTISAASQDYLKAIYELSERYGRASTSQIADQLAIKPASVTGMLQKMAQDEPPLVTYRKHCWAKMWVLWGLTTADSGGRLIKSSGFRIKN